MAAATDSKSVVRKGVWVRLPLRAQGRGTLWLVTTLPLRLRCNEVQSVVTSWSRSLLGALLTALYVLCRREKREKRDKVLTSLFDLARLRKNARKVPSPTFTPGQPNTLSGSHSPTATALACCSRTDHTRVGWYRCWRARKAMARAAEWSQRQAFSAGSGSGRVEAARREATCRGVHRRRRRPLPDPPRPGERATASAPLNGGRLLAAPSLGDRDGDTALVRLRPTWYAARCGDAGSSKACRRNRCAR